MLNPISNFYFKMLVLLSKKLYLHIRVNNNTTFGTIFARRNFISKKYPYAEALVIQMLLRIVYTIPLSKFSTFGAKLLPRRRFLQHYYRNMFIESHKKPTDVL